MLRILVLAGALSIAGSVEAATYRLFFEVENGTYRDLATNSISHSSISGSVDVTTTPGLAQDAGNLSRTFFGGATGHGPSPIGAVSFSTPLASLTNPYPGGEVSSIETVAQLTFDYAPNFKVETQVNQGVVVRHGSSRYVDATSLLFRDIMPPRNGDGTSDYTVSEAEFVSYLRDLVSAGTTGYFNRNSYTVESYAYTGGYEYYGSMRFTGMTQIDGIDGDPLAPVPVPAGLALLGSAFVMLGGFGAGRRRRLKAA